MGTKNQETVVQLSNGLSKLMRFFQKIVLILQNIATSEKTLDLISKDFFLENSSSKQVQEDMTYKEMEIIIDSELKELKSRRRAFNIAKVMLIVFEALNGYLASGILIEITHINFGSPIVKVIIQFVFGALLSFAILYNAIKAMSPTNRQEDRISYWIPIIFICMLPILNLFLILVTPEVSNKLVYVVAAIFTLIVGLILVIQAKSTKESNHQRFNKLSKYKKTLLERSKFYKDYNNMIIRINEMRPEYVGLFDENYLQSQNVENDLIELVKNPNQWCKDYIEANK